MLRTGYTTRVRPWRDDGGDVEIRWYKCAPGAKALPYPSLFRSLHWEAYPYLFANGKGEVFNSPVKVYPYKSPPGVTGQDHCGTETDFSRGGHYDPVSPPYPRGADGIALCCRPDLGCLLVDGIGAAAPGFVSPFSTTDGLVTNPFTPFPGPPSVDGLTGVTFVSAEIGIVLNYSAANVVVTPGDWIAVPLAAKEQVGDWFLYWASGGGIVGFLGTAPTAFTNEFLGQVPPAANRLVVQWVRPDIVLDTWWQMAPHVVPPPPP